MAIVNKFGVFGIGGNYAFPERPETLTPFSTGVGVYGRGDSVGTVGVTNVPLGQGVSGIGLGHNTVGVVGISTDNNGVHGRSDEKTAEWLGRIL
jgi:hypothetical protein